MNITLFLIASSAAATDHNSPIPKGLHHRPTREHYNPLRGEREASSQVGICEVLFCIHDAVTKKDIPGVDSTITCQISVKKLQLTASLQKVSIKYDCQSSGLFKLYNKQRWYLIPPHAALARG